MREIKFRGKSLETGKWIYGSVSVYPNDIFIVSYGIGTKVDPATVGQFTGKYDVHNNEIHKDDILKYENPEYPNHKPYVIRWSEEDCCFECVNSENFMLPDVWCEMEIIGNVFDTPGMVDKDIIMDIYSFKE